MRNCWDVLGDELKRVQCCQCATLEELYDVDGSPWCRNCLENDMIGDEPSLTNEERNA